MGSSHRDTLLSYDIEADKNLSLAEAIDAMDALLTQCGPRLDRLRQQRWQFECFVGMFLNGNRTEVLSWTQMSRWAAKG
ncbi:hypothetical protein GCM10023165_54110 [Variovorax defluvii]|uniref:Uncharacterized protein n=1 Tax=Variovorax defluvii TaxID=913761 RepID=A0ABP8IH65_9BURK